MKWSRRASTVVLLLSVGACTNFCTPLGRCGLFDFTGSKVDTSETNGIDMQVSFDFNPESCGSACTCNLVAYVQIVRTVDMESGIYIYPSSEKQDRATAAGWYIDRVAGRKWGYYGRNDDGSFAWTLDPGSETEPAILVDKPERAEAEPWLDIWWQAVSVPACIQDTSGCSNRLLGYYFWSWLVDDAGTVSDPVHANAWEPMQADFDAAVGEWNAQAPGLGKNTFPAFTQLAP